MSVKQFLDIVFPNRPAFLKPDWIQGIPLRSVFMMAAINEAAKGGGGRPLRILEVGSWMGSSCLTWCEALRLFNGGQGEVTCVDPLTPYFSADEMLAVLNHPDAAVLDSQQQLIQEMDALLRGDYVHDILMHNVGSVPPPTKVAVIRQPAVTALPALPDHSFDVVYLDGSHFFDEVRHDLENAIRLVKEGGFICGDDLELEAHEVDLQFAWAHRDRDFPTDPRTGQQFHPGVTLAVGHRLGKVSNYFGFWLMRRNGSEFQPVDFASFPIVIPSHFPQQFRETILLQLRQLGLIAGDTAP